MRIVSVHQVVSAYVDKEKAFQGLHTIYGIIEKISRDFLSCDL